MRLRLPFVHPTPVFELKCFTNHHCGCSSCIPDETKTCFVASLCKSVLVLWLQCVSFCLKLENDCETIKVVVHIHKTHNLAFVSSMSLTVFQIQPFTFVCLLLPLPDNKLLLSNSSNNLTMLLTCSCSCIFIRLALLFLLPQLRSL